MNDADRLKESEISDSFEYESTFDERGNLTAIFIHDEEYLNEYHDDLLHFISSFHHLRCLEIEVKWHDLIFTNLDDLRWLIHLEKLAIAPCQLNDIRVLASLTKLRELSLPRASIKNLAPLSELQSLTHLHLYANLIDDISPLAGHTNLISVNLSNNLLRDISALISARNLQELFIDHNQVTDLSPVAALINLTHLHARTNAIKDIAPLEELINLASLHLSGNPISSLNPLERLIHLEELDVSNTSIVSLQPIRRLSRLKRLSASHIQPFDTAILAAFTELTSLSLNHCRISDLSFVTALNGLMEIVLNDNQIEDASALLSLPDLHRASLRNNQIAQPFSIYPYHLFQLDLSGNVFGNKLYRNTSGYLIDAANYYFDRNELDMALAYHYVEADEKVTLLIYYKKLLITDPSEPYYRLYYVMRCEGVLRKLSEEDDEIKTIREELIAIIESSDFFNRAELLHSLVEAGKPVVNYNWLSEYTAYLKNAPNPKPNTEIVYFIAKIFSQREDLPQLLSIYRQLIDKNHPFQYTLYRMIEKVIGSRYAFAEYDHYLDSLNHAKHRDIPYFDVQKFLNTTYGNWVHDQPPYRAPSKDWLEQAPDNTSGWKLLAGLIIFIVGFFLLKACSP